MKYTKILITGASGLLGANLVYHYVGRANVTGFYATRPISIDGANLERIDLVDHGAVALAMERLEPELVVHCAAATNVEWCERNPEAARAINYETTLFLAEQSSKVGAKFIFTSTDSVFDGIKGGYSEGDPPGPLNSYAEGKAETEKSLGEIDDDALIIRSYFYGFSPSGTRSLLEWVLNRARAGSVIPGFTDSLFSPISVYDFAEALDMSVDAGGSGILHFGSRDGISKYEFAQIVMEVYGCDMSLLRPITVDDAGLSADRPRNTSLNVEMLAGIMGRPVSTVRDGIERVASESNRFPQA